ncbi:hypothetical protein B0T37_04325 [Chromobacterium violaceum]|uniref:DUF5983 family protein n=1 Tax=Chromobacterium violaceum TaxID=536 RepID=UPI0009DB3B94|nr:hypothetical protein [Chromobacterium violaceum]OQS11666.1 hypothetical protein B0T38_02965 [Chromobacterium violaceum]OQS29199.1 hypothetical protein B0T37_04325 [Chromobacterium violaceum]
MNWIMTLPVLSTSHIREQTNAWLQNHAGDWGRMTFAEYGSGYFIALGESDSDPVEQFPQHPDLQQLMRWVQTHYPAATWLRLDADGDVVPELPTYDW